MIDGAFMFSYNAERGSYSVYPSLRGKPDSSRKIATLSYFIYKIKGNPLNWDGKNFYGIDFSDSKNRIGANSGYCGQAIKLNCACCSRISVLVSIVSLNALTIKAAEHDDPY